MFIRDTSANFPPAGAALGGGPRLGQLAIALDTGMLWYWTGSAWAELSGGGGDDVGLPISNSGDLTDVTPVTALAAPAAGKRRLVRRAGWSVSNIDDQPRTITFQKNTGGVITNLRTVIDVPAGGLAVYDAEVSLTATNMSIENECDVPNSLQPQFDVSASEYDE